MSETQVTHKLVTETVSDPETEKRIISFNTAKGSVYMYDGEGKTTRFKTTTGEQMKRQDVTVFVNMMPDQERVFLDALHNENPDSKTKVYVLERQLDELPKIIRDVRDVSLPDRLYLGIMKDGQLIGANPASLTPNVGANVFDYSHYVENGEEVGERHLGNKVTEITYED